MANKVEEIADVENSVSAKEEGKESKEQTQESNSNSEQEIKEELDPIIELELKVKEANEKYVRLYSEFENFRRRTAKEKLELISNASEKVIKELLPVLDDLERAIESNKSIQDAEVVKQGFDLVYHKLNHNLKSNGLSSMESKGKDFDVDNHEAITKIPVKSKKEKGKVVDVIEKGYYLNDKVIRFAKVVVGE